MRPVLLILAATGLLLAPAACGNDGGSGGGSKSDAASEPEKSSLGALCTKETVDEPSEECGGLHCLVEGCTGRCTSRCDPAKAECPEGFECTEWLSPTVTRCYPKQKCTKGGGECPDGYACVIYVKCDAGEASNYYQCVPDSLGIPDATWK